MAIDDTRRFTVTAQVAFLPLPSLAVAVIVAVPFDTAVTFPFWSTVAADVLVELQVTLLLLAVLGEIVAVKVSLAPSFKDRVLLFKLIPVTRVVTVTVHVAFLPLPSVAEAVMTALPLPTAVTFPAVLTVAAAVLEEVQESTASEGSTVATRVSSSPV